MEVRDDLDANACARRQYRASWTLPSQEVTPDGAPEREKAVSRCPNAVLPGLRQLGTYFCVLESQRSLEHSGQDAAASFTRIISGAHPGTRRAAVRAIQGFSGKSVISIFPGRRLLSSSSRHDVGAALCRYCRSLTIHRYPMFIRINDATKAIRRRPRSTTSSSDASAHENPTEAR